MGKSEADLHRFKSPEHHLGGCAQTFLPGGKRVHPKIRMTLALSSVENLPHAIGSDLPHAATVPRRDREILTILDVLAED